MASRTNDLRTVLLETTSNVVLAAAAWVRYPIRRLDGHLESTQRSRVFATCHRQRTQGHAWLATSNRPGRGRHRRHWYLYIDRRGCRPCGARRYSLVLDC